MNKNSGWIFPVGVFFMGIIFGVLIAFRLLADYGLLEKLL